ncbi:FadR/GntR family transcriptional regulator [Nocardia harenae]|uniref:FadR/GntR family transcriptional regulator n=1 Tax=Nocardia harenae TaxID=358707 RepID=UPI000A705B51|nr:FCD domain-containing protein [Nocardia harenae]
MTSAKGAAARNNQVRPKKMPEVIADRIRRMIARGQIGDGEWLPTEPELMEHFGVSRPTLREAFRLLEADSLVSIRRGPPGGARVTIPGPEAAAAQFGLLLTLSKTTLQDVYEARMVIEPACARRVAERGPAANRRALAAEVEHVREALQTPIEFGRRTVQFHRRLVELSGNHTLATVIGMLTELVERQTEQRYDEKLGRPEELDADNQRGLRAYERLSELVTARDGEAAEAFWLKHMRAARSYLLRNGGDSAQVVDLLY